MSRRCPHLGERLWWRGHRCQQNPPIEIMEDSLKEEALAGDWGRPCLMS